MLLYKRCRCAQPARCRHPFHFRFELDGREYRRSSRTPNRQLAERIATKRHAAVLEGREGLRATSRVRLSAHIATYVAHTAIVNRSGDKDARVLAGLLQAVGDRPLAEITPFAVEAWRRGRAAAVSPSTVNRELNIVRGCFSRAVEWKRLAVSPMHSIKPYRVENVRLRVLSVDETRRVLDGCHGDLRLLARLTLESLLRLSEALALRREDIGSNAVTIINAKSGKPRRVPLTADLRRDLLARCHSSGSVFGVGEAGQPPQRAAVSVAFTRQMRALGLAGVSHHVLRHTGATAMVRAGVSLRAVQEIGGWTSLRMVERYAHVEDAELHRAVALARAHAAGTLAGTSVPSVTPFADHDARTTNRKSSP